MLCFVNTVLGFEVGEVAVIEFVAEMADIEPAHDSRKISLVGKSDEWGEKELPDQSGGDGGHYESFRPSSLEKLARIHMDR